MHNSTNSLKPANIFKCILFTLSWPQKKTLVWNLQKLWRVYLTSSLPATAFRLPSSSSVGSENEGRADPRHRCPVLSAIPAVHPQPQQGAALQRRFHATGRCLVANCSFLPFPVKWTQKRLIHEPISRSLSAVASQRPNNFLHVYFNSAVNLFFRFRVKKKTSQEPLLIKSVVTLLCVG